MNDNPVNREIINPWSWQDKLGFVQANDISGYQRVLLCAGQTAMDADGQPVHKNDMRAQMTLVLDNLETVLSQAGLTLSNVMRLNYYTTDVDRFFNEYDVITTRLQNAECRPAATLLGVQRLAFPDLLVEIEATAVS